MSSAGRHGDQGLAGSYLTFKPCETEASWIAEERFPRYHHGLVTESFLNRFSGIGRLYGLEALESFQRAHIAIIGIGGVGSWAAESLARSGVGRFTLVDLDDLCVTNTNRQIHATASAMGRSKAQVMAERLREINPEIEVTVRQEFFTEANAEEILATAFDAVVDAIDSMRPKCDLLSSCRRMGLPVFTSGGAGGRSEVTKIEIGDLSRSHGCALLLQVRRNLRNHYQFPAGGKKTPKFGITAVFSSEQPRYPTADGCTSLQRPEEMPAGLRCDAGYGTVTHITASFGLALAGEILKTLAQKKTTESRPSSEN